MTNSVSTFETKAKILLLDFSKEKLTNFLGVIRSYFKNLVNLNFFVNVVSVERINLISKRTPLASERFIVINVLITKKLEYLFTVLISYIR